MQFIGNCRRKIDRFDIRTNNYYAALTPSSRRWAVMPVILGEPHRFRKLRGLGG
jgi:hypothetical protein